MAAHEMHGTHCIAAWCGRGRVYWTGCGFSTHRESARRYRGNHEVMTAVKRMRADAMRMGAQQVSVVAAPRTKKRTRK